MSPLVFPRFQPPGATSDRLEVPLVHPSGPMRARRDAGDDGEPLAEGALRVRSATP